ncbi:M56 family metallopeptidase [Prosthecobacter sp.]|uniref:M56 family metallopeptidase n=1 Tax=Prosthecobacter sp. TaxID=1965333 RepID=UPI0037839203
MESVEIWSQALLLLSWKGTLLALAVGLVLLLLHRHLSPAWRHGLWLLVLLRFILPDFGQFALSLHGLTDAPAIFEPAPVAVPEEVVMMNAPAEASVIHHVEETVERSDADSTAVPASPPAAAVSWWSLRQMLCVLWLGGAGAVLSVMVVLHLRLKRRIRKDASEAFSELRAVMDEACNLAGVRRAPRLLVTDAVRAPSLFGVLNPVILLPRQVAAGRDAAALKLILLHELAHLKRRDLWAQILASCVLALHWYNPMVWVAARRLRTEAEMAADAHALRCTDATEAHRYGEMLLGFAKHATAGWVVWLASASLLGISENKHDLRRRIEGLMDIARGRRTRWVIGLGAFLLLAAIGLTSAPAEEAKKVAAKEAAKAEDNSPTTVVAGIVVDEEGRPVRGAKVRLQMDLTGRGDWKERWTGEDGKFSFEAVPKSASLNLRAQHADYAESNYIAFLGISESQERRLVMARTSWIMGKITDKRDGRPIKDARVFIGVENKVTLVSRYDWKQPFARTDEAGAYRLPVKLRELNGVIVRAWAEDMASQSKVIDIKQRETVFDAALEPVERIPGKVVNFEGEAVKEAMVWVVEDSAWLDESTQPISSAMMRSNDRVKLASGKFFISLDYSKEDGSFALPDVDPLLKNKLWVVAMHPMAGFSRMQARELKAGAVFKLERWASLSGRMIRNDGTPVADATGIVQAKGDADFLASGPDTLKIRHTIKFTTDKDGNYKIDHILPGASFNGVTVEGEGIKNEYLPTTLVTVGSGPQNPRQLTLGTSLRSQTPSAGRAVQGRVVLPEGFTYRSDAYFINLSINRDGVIVPGMLQPDQDGRFITDKLQPGNYEISVYVNARTSGMSLPTDVGRWMRFQVEAGNEASPLRLADLVLNKEDLTPKPRAEITTAASEPAVFIEGPDGKVEITTVDRDKKPVPGVKIEVLDYVDHAHNPMRLDKVLVKPVVATSDDRGKATLMFPRMPAPGRKAFGVQVVGTGKDGFKSRKIELMDGRKSDLRVYPETAVDLTFSTPIVKWSVSSSPGLIAEDQPLQDGRVKTRFALEHGTYFLLQGTTADGRVLFSKAIRAAKDRSEEVKMTVALTPGVEIEGKVEGLPSDYEGDGGVIARVYVKSEGEMNQIMKGYPPSAPWVVWAPVGRDGRFHFTGMPRGMVSLCGLGKGWTTRGPLRVESATLVNLASSSGKEVVTLNTRPCVKRTARILLPDGTPAAGATVQLNWPGLELVSYGRTNMHAEDAERHAQFKKEPWTATQLVADAQGQLELLNRVAGKGYCQVYWTDAKTQRPRSGTGNFTIEEQASDSLVPIQVTEK